MTRIYLGLCNGDQVRSASKFYCKLQLVVLYTVLAVSTQTVMYIFLYIDL
jgi:hypothetical protein